jgi:hypothetical protein
MAGDGWGAVSYVIDLLDERKALLAALKEAENALADYIPTIEKTGASLNYGHRVLRQCRAAIAKAEGQHVRT